MVSLIRGRFRKPADRLAARYTASVGFDCRLYPYDIAGSIAHARMLARQGIISPGEAETIAGGLAAIREDIEQGRFEFEPALEDVHMNIEAALIKRVGEVGGKLHTARSRNDQVALDLRLYAREAIKETLTKIRRLQTAVVDLAEANKGVPMPGFTHLQPAQPVLFAHHLLAYFEMLSRDAARFQGALERVDVMPLGSGALAGV
ncbi:MAG: argininosuccinate lyase, partial [Chloroflexi bacterium]|nr:argininosuccinate lyase [Chloroflexota bacterium]